MPGGKFRRARVDFFHHTANARYAHVCPDGTCSLVSRAGHARLKALLDERKQPRHFLVAETKSMWYDCTQPLPTAQPGN